MSASEFAGLTAVVTCGASGIGPAMARLLAARRARVACLGLKPDDLRCSRSAAIFNTCPIAETAGLPDRALYSSTKGAVLSLPRATAADLVLRDPGELCQPRHRRHAVDRPSAGPRRQPRGRTTAVDTRQPMGRLVTAAVAYRAGPLSGSTTGTDLAVNGGMHGLRSRPRA